MVAVAKSRNTTVFAGVALFAVAALLYGPYLNSPPFFDDVDYFNQARTALGNLSWSHRAVSQATLALTYRFWGLSLGAYRAGNLLFHALTAISLFLFIRELLAHEHKEDADRLAFGAALLFALHPVAAFAVGYIYQRSIILAGLFSIWMWISVHRGVKDGRKSWLLLSAAFYLLAVHSKEHAVTALPVAVLIGWNAAGGNVRKTLSALALPMSLWAVTAVAIILQMKGIIGVAYEPSLGEMGIKHPQANDHLLLRSYANQSGLYFKYLSFWLAPYEGRMAVDIRVPFPPTWSAWPWVLGFFAFAAWGILGALALWRGWIPRLLGIGLLAPWLLFLTMFGTVLYQEPFVLYRSYLWALPGTLAVAVLLSKLPRRGQIIVLAVAGISCFAFTWSRLQIFADPVSLWNEAVNRLDGRDDLPGAYRIYHNRGTAYANKRGRQNMLLAIADYSREIQLNPADATVYQARGTAYLDPDVVDLPNALADFNSALSLRPTYPLAQFRRGLILFDLGHRQEGLADLAHTCFSYRVGCDAYADLSAR